MDENKIVSVSINKEDSYACLYFADGTAQVLKESQVNIGEVIESLLKENKQLRIKTEGYHSNWIKSSNELSSKGRVPNLKGRGLI